MHHTVAVFIMENTGFDYVVKPLGEFAKGSIRLIKKCTKPDRSGEKRPAACHLPTNACSTDTELIKNGIVPVVAALEVCLYEKMVRLASDSLHGAEFKKICFRVGLGFAVLGFVGFFVKMIFIVRPSALKVATDFSSSESQLCLSVRLLDAKMLRC